MTIRQQYVYQSLTTLFMFNSCPGDYVRNDLSVGLVTLLQDTVMFGGGSIRAICAALKLAWGSDELQDSMIRAINLVHLAGNASSIDASAIMSLLHDVVTSAMEEPALPYLSLTVGFMNVLLLPSSSFCVSEYIKPWMKHIVSLIAELERIHLPKTRSSLRECASRSEEAQHLKTVYERESISIFNSRMLPSSIENSMNVLMHLWNRPIEARNWLDMTKLSLGTRASNLGSFRAVERQSLSETSRLVSKSHEDILNIVLSFMYHGDENVQAAALDALKELAVHIPAAVSFKALPIVVHRIHRLSCGLPRTTSLDTCVKSHESDSNIILHYLNVLSKLAHYDKAVPFILRALQPLLIQSAPVLLQGVAVRILAGIWIETGRGYPHLRTSLLSYQNLFEKSQNEHACHGAATGNLSSLPLRLAVASSVHDVCTKDAMRSAELIPVLYAALQDHEPQVHAAVLHALADMCEQDALDFFGCWHVVRQLYPTMPEHSLSAVAWVRLLGAAQLDAEVFPEVTGNIVDALWIAATSQVAAIRGQAYKSLASFDLAILGEIGALGPLWEYPALLEQEVNGQEMTYDDSCIKNCESLISHVLQYDAELHRTRAKTRAGEHLKVETTSPVRYQSKGRMMLWSAKLQEGHQSLSTIYHKLIFSLPKIFLQSSRSTCSASGFAVLVPDLNPAAVLYLWEPVSKKGRTADEMMKSYEDVFKAICSMPLTLEGSRAMLPLHGPSIEEELSAWSCFVSRWLVAVEHAIDANRQSNRGKEGDVEAMGEAVQMVASRLFSEFRTFDVHKSPKAAYAIVALVYHCIKQRINVSEIVETYSTMLLELIEGLIDGQNHQNGEGHQQVPDVVRGCSCVALGYMFSAMRKYLGHKASELALELLLRGLRSTEDARYLAERSNPMLQIGCAIGGGFACHQLGTRHGEGDKACIGWIIEILSVLIHLSDAFTQDNRSAKVTKLLMSAGIRMGDVKSSTRKPVEHAIPRDHVDVRQAALSSLSNSIPSLLLLDQGSELLSALSRFVMQMVEDDFAVETNAELLAAIVNEAYSNDSISSLEVAEITAKLRALLLSSEGRIRAFSAVAIGKIIPVIGEQGFPFGLFLHSVDPSLACSDFLGFLQNSSDASSSLLKRGILRGIEGLVSRYPSSASDAIPIKRLLEVLQPLALKDKDAQVQRISGWILARMSYQARFFPQVQRQEGLKGEYNASGSQQNVVGASLSLWHVDSAIRYVVDVLAMMQWPDDDDSAEESESQQQTLGEVREVRKKLTSLQAGTLLRSLSSVAELPALNWTALLRQLMRYFPGNEDVQRGCIRLVLSHAQDGEVYQLRAFVEDIIFRSDRFESLKMSAKLDALKGFAKLLCLLPAGDRSMFLDRMCTWIILMMRKQEKHRLSLKARSLNGEASSLELESHMVAALVRGLSELARGNEALSDVARKSIFLKIMPCLQSPPTEVIGIRTVEKSRNQFSKQMECSPWIEILMCALSLNHGVVQTWIQDAESFRTSPLHWTWLTTALLSNGAKFDLSVLHQCRSAFMSGDVFSDPAMEDIATLMISRAFASPNPAIPAYSKQQWIFDLAKASEKCSNPRGSSRLVIACTVGLSICDPQADIAMPARLMNYGTALTMLPSSLLTLASESKPLCCDFIKALIHLLSVDFPIEHHERELRRHALKRCAVSLKQIMGNTWLEVFMNKI